MARAAVGSAYLAAKAGARHFMHSIALELAAYGITANAIAPGIFATNIGGDRTLDAGVQAAIRRVIPMHRVGQPDDFKALALFLASPASEYITGQEIVIDGGMALGFADRRRAARPRGTAGTDGRPSPARPRLPELKHHRIGSQNGCGPLGSPSRPPRSLDNA